MRRGASARGLTMVRTRFVALDAERGRGAAIEVDREAGDDRQGAGGGAGAERTRAVFGGAGRRG